MKRISTATAVQNRFVDGNKSTGQKATQFSAEWCNQVQEEIAGLLESNGITLGESDNQLAELFAKVFLEGFLGIRISQERGVFETNITPGNVKTYGGDGFEARLLGGGLLRLGGNGISVYSTKGDTETLLGSILWDRENNRFNVTGAFKGSDIKASEFILAGWSFEKTQHGDLILYGNDGNTKTAVLKVYSGGNIELLRYVGKTNNVILATEDMVRLTENPYSSLPVGTMIVIVNDRTSGDVIVITNDVGFTDVISGGRFHTYLKGTSGWKTQEL